MTMSPNCSRIGAGAWAGYTPCIMLPTDPPFTLQPLGDAAARVWLGPAIDPQTRSRLRAFTAWLAQADVPGITEWVPAYETVAVFYRPEQTTYAALCAALQGWTPGDSAPNDMPGPIITLPVRYGGADGPDLDAVARLHHCTPADVVARHAAPIYDVVMLGFLPGFPYLSGLPETLHTPRLAVPRALVPAGSVGIGGAQTGVYPCASPGGWRLIGRTDMSLFDVQADPPALLRPGDRVRFVPL